MQWIDARADAFETGLHQAAIVGSSWVRGLLLAGLLDRADDASRQYRERCEGATGIAYLVTSAMCGAVARARGQIRTAVRLFGQSLAAGADTGVQAFTLPVDLPGALGTAGDVTSARDAVRRMSPVAQYQGISM